jgi:predicted Fe-Mo cluster-binding NifX family protein
MKIAIATNDFIHVAGHAGQSRHWLLHDSEAGAAEAERITLDKARVFHHWEDDAPHPLDGIEVIIAGSAGDGFLRRMQQRGIEVLLTGEKDAEKALAAVLAGEVLPDPRFNPTLVLCKLRDLFSRH